MSSKLEPGNGHRTSYPLSFQEDRYDTHRGTPDHLSPWRPPCFL